MLLKIRPEHLRPGMFVVLPAKWLEHSFLKSRFLIKSQEQVDKIRKSGFEEVLIDTEKGISPADRKKAGGGQDEKAALAKFDPGILKEAVFGRDMEPEQKARIVYLSSLEIMVELLENPVTENIIAAKKGFFHVVEGVFSDNMSSYLIKLLRHDYSTYSHSVNVGTLSLLLSKSLLGEKNSHNIHEVGAGFFLHDLGKARIAPEIINKAGMLTQNEWRVMKTHPEEGYRLLSETGQLSEESGIIVMQHHEKENGTGYPLGLKGDQVSIYARICRMDVFDALTSQRPYRKQLTAYGALSVMKETMGFSGELFNRFVLLFEEKKRCA
ncbi:MAG: DUF3391 domain-containing protein [Nitrospiraceae bacterium]|nr:DUF3391 domain-containing protein [Nitrospiraceae bacterium]